MVSFSGRTDHYFLDFGRFYFFDEGLLVEEGTPEHFFTNPKEDRTKLFLSQIL